MPPNKLEPWLYKHDPLADADFDTHEKYSNHVSLEKRLPVVLPVPP